MTDTEEEGRLHRARRSAGDRVSRARRTADEVRHRVEDARPQTPVIDTAYEMYEHDSSIAGGMLAGAIAFRLFLVLVPLLLVLVAGLGFLHVAGAETSTANSLDFSQTLVDTMNTVGQNAARGRWVTLIVGVGAVAWAMRTLVKSLRIVHHLAWRLGRRPAGAKPLAVLGGVGVLTLVIGFSFLAQWLRGHTAGGGIVVSFVIGAMAGVIWFLVEQMLPRADGSPWWYLVPGAVVMAVSTQLLHAFTVFYLAGRINRMNQTYGPLGVAIVVLLWLYLLGRAIVAAAVVNATLWDRSQRGARIWAPVDVSLFRPGRGSPPDEP